MCLLIFPTILLWRDNAEQRLSLESQAIKLHNQALPVTRYETPKRQPIATTRSTPTVKPQAKAVPMVSTILYMEGWIDEGEFYNGEFNLYLDHYSERECGYKCVSARTGETRFSHADFVVFQPSTLRLEPPGKHPHQYWILKSFKELGQQDLNNIKKRGYDKLLDYYMIRPRFSVTPLTFIERVNALQGGLDVDLKMMNYIDRRLPLNFAQIILMCASFDDPDVVHSAPEHSLGSQLSKLEPQARLLTMQMCFDRQPGIHLPLNITFAILDATDCHNSLVDQFLFILRSGCDVIPIVPLLMHEDTIADLESLAPPHSFISMSKFSDVKSLLKHLRDVTTDSKLFHRYHQWKASYTLKSETALDPIKSAICRFCQLGFERPENNERVVAHRCDHIV